MPFKIVRNDIVKMNTEAIVNTANDHVSVGIGCDYAIYTAAGYDRLLRYREEHIGYVREGEVFITPGFDLPAKYIIHAVSPLYRDGESGEEEKLRACYRKSLELAKERQIKSIAFPLISTGSFGYPKEEGLRIAVDEISAFLLSNEMMVYLVVFDAKATQLGGRLEPALEEYIDSHYVEARQGGEPRTDRKASSGTQVLGVWGMAAPRGIEAPWGMKVSQGLMRPQEMAERPRLFQKVKGLKKSVETADDFYEDEEGFSEGSFDIEEHEDKLSERLSHISDTFSEYLLYLIQEKGMENADVYKRAIVDKKTFSKIKNHADYHPQKITALCLCVGARLNLDETRDLLARAGYALSPCDKTDIIFSYFIENQIYDMIEIDIQLEEHGVPCIIA